jgi:rfaE bifunctional protein nucleotidyltransferase chain/domain
MGDLLVVGLNSDSSTRRLKGPDRPLVQEDDRAELVAALACVDYVTLFDGPTPEAFLETIRPAVHVKGGDYRPEQLPEARVVTAHGGRVVIVPFVEGRSSSIIIERIARAQSRTDG